MLPACAFLGVDLPTDLLKKIPSFLMRCRRVAWLSYKEPAGIAISVVCLQLPHLLVPFVPFVPFVIS